MDEPTIREKVAKIMYGNIPHSLDEQDINDMVQLIKQARIAEVDRYADYLTDMETEAAFEMGYGEYAYKRIREIDAEGGAPMA